MRRFLALLLCLLPLAAAAQEDQAARDRGILQAFLEDNLSDAGRTVRIEGFEGALSAKASIKELTIADDTGVWLTLRGVVLDWSRAALLRGRLEVAELSAEEILLPRKPGAGEASKAADAPSPVARPFSLPELPVSVQIGKISAEKVSLGAALFGEAATVRLTGGLSLKDGEGAASLAVTRIDGEEGALSLAASYANETDRLKLALSLFEGADGMVSELLNLPGRPPLALDISGDAPLTDFTAQIALASDGVPRLTGTVGISEERTGDTTPPIRLVVADLGGDMAPLFAPDLRPFFGPEIRLSFSAIRQPDGRVELPALSLSAASLQLGGSLALRSDGLPERFDLLGLLEADGPVTLPLSGPPTQVRRAEIAAQYDADDGDAWTLDLAVEQFARSGISLGAAALRGGGTIGQGLPRRVTAALTGSASGIDPGDPALAQALGDALQGSTTLSWQEGNALAIDALELRGAGLELSATGMVDGFSAGIPVSGHLRLVSNDISRFAALAGRPIAGAAELEAEGRATLLTGGFDVDLTAATESLQTGIPQLDPLLPGITDLRLIARRDEAGTTLEQLFLKNAMVQVRASGDVSETDATLVIDAQLAELRQVEPSLSGPASFDGRAVWKQGAPIAFDGLRIEGAGAVLTGAGTLDIEAETLPAAGRVELSVPDLSVFAPLAGRALGGAADLTVSGSGGLRGGDFALELDASTQNLAAGLGDLDKLTAGPATLSLEARREGTRIFIPRLNLETRQGTARVSGGVGGEDSLDFSATLNDLALLAPDFPGPASATGTAKAVGQDWRLALDATGPGGTTGAISGMISGDLKSVDLALSGTAPLGLANSFIAPRSVLGTARYNLQMTGRPGLPGLSGVVSTSDARLVSPALGITLGGIDARATLAGGRASITASGEVDGGGRVSVSGPVSLQPPFDADLDIRINRVVLRDPELYQTRITGDLALTGPLTGGGRITGALNLGEAEVRIPSSTASVQGAVPEGLRHINEPGAVRATRVRAGMAGGKGGGGGGGAVFGLDLTIRAPNQIFVRGRGLDAELGGQLRLAGTTADVVPIGRFDLIRGRLDILGKRMALEEGRIQLQGAFDPYLRLVATADADDDAGTVIQVVLEGPLSAPEVVFESQPQLPQDEVVARLLFGRGLDTISPFQAAQLAAAVATLSGNEAANIVGRLRENFGLDDLDVTTDEEGTTSLRAGKYLSDNVYTDIAVDSAGKSEINLNLDVTPQVTVKGTLDSEGNTGVGVFYERNY